MRINNLVVVIALFASHQLFAQIPTISSFSPASGAVGSTVTITGTNFGSTPTDNIVFFGAVRATVKAATFNSLTVSAPAGTTYQPISVTVNGLSAYAANPYIITFPDSVTTFTANSFASKTDFGTGTYPKIMVVNDFDGNGKPDLAVVNQVANSISVLRNISSDSIVLFSQKVDYNSGNAPINIVASDLDGDGRNDLAVTNFNSGGIGEISIYKNTSSNGNISFSPGITFATGEGAIGIDVGDLNSDGRPDIVVTTSNAGTYSIFKNISTAGNILLATRQDVLFYRGDEVAISDMDGDNKPDLVFTNSITSSIAVQRNTSTPEIISFEAGVSFGTGAYPTKIALGDFDGDNKKDIAVTNYSGKSISILRNTSTIGNLSFETAVNYSTVINPTDISTTDLDGDGKPDLITGNGNNGNVTVFKNNSSTGNILFDTAINYTTGNFDTFCATGDFSGDGRQDIAVSNTLLNTISILKNKIGLSIPLSLCPPSANSNISAGISGTVYQWQVNTGNGFFNIINNDYYSNANGAILQLINIPSIFNGYKYRCAIDGNFSDLYKISFSNTWTGFADNNWNNPANWKCSSIPDNNTDVIINDGTMIINSNVTINSLVINPGVSLTVNTGFNLVILHSTNQQNALRK